MHKEQRKARPPQKLLYPEYNQINIDKAVMAAAIFRKQYESSQELRDETAAQNISRYMALKKWNSSIFQQRTGLNAGIYRKIIAMPNKKLELPIVVSICVGLSLPQEIARKLIEKAGYALNLNSLEDMAYNMILSGALPNDIIACNAFIESILTENQSGNIRLLGSQAYDKNT